MNETVIGVVADTHVPDRVNSLHPGLCAVLQNAGVRFILHAGDACCQSIIEELKRIAPVKAVQGNRDLFFNGNVLPKTMRIEISGKKIGLMHGFGNFGLYVLEKFNLLFHGYQFSYFRKLAIKTFPDADIIIFGHTHRPENVYIDGKLIFNPGSAVLGGWGFPPSCGILKIASDGGICAEIVELTGAVRRNGKWELAQGD